MTRHRWGPPGPKLAWEGTWRRCSVCGLKKQTCRFRTDFYLGEGDAEVCLGTNIPTPPCPASRPILGATDPIPHGDEA